MRGQEYDIVNKYQLQVVSFDDLKLMHQENMLKYHLKAHTLVQDAIDFCAMKSILEPVISSNKIITTAQIIMQPENQHTGIASSKEYIIYHHLSKHIPLL